MSPEKVGEEARKMCDQENIGVRLREIRIQKGYTQLEIAEKLNISRQAVSRWERGESYPDIDNLTQLSEIYEVSVDTLVGKKSSEHTENRKDRKVNKEINRESIGAIVILVISLLHPVLGLAMCSGVAWWLVARKKHYKIVIIVLVVCVLVNLYNLYVILNSVYQFNAETTIEKVD